jgi:hypothetical protein
VQGMALSWNRQLANRGSHDRPPSGLREATH